MRVRIKANKPIILNTGKILIDFKQDDVKDVDVESSNILSELIKFRYISVLPIGNAQNAPVKEEKPKRQKERRSDSS